MLNGRLFFLCIYAAFFALHICATAQKKKSSVSPAVSYFASDERPLVAENFNDNRYAWFLFKDSAATTQFKDGTLTLRNFHAASFSSATRPISVDQSKDFRIDIYIRTTTDDEKAKFGIIWGSKNNSNYNVCWIRYGGHIEAQSIRKSAVDTLVQLSEIIPKTLSDLWNIITLEQKARNLTLRINGKEYCSFYAPTFTGQLFGIAAAGRITVSLDSLTVFQRRPPVILVNNLPKTVKKEALSKVINSPYTEKLPVISADGRTLWFTRAYHPQNIGIDRAEDIWYSTMNDDGTWTEAVNPGAPLNNEYPNSVISVTPDNNTLLLYGIYEKEANNLQTNNDSAQNIQNRIIRRHAPEYSAGFFTSYRTSNGWSAPKPVFIHNFEPLGDKISACLSSDQKTMIISMEREDSHGQNDLYVCDAMPDGSWSEPRNLGPGINSFDDDSNPFLAADGITLYFATAGRSGYGDKDIFLSRRLDDTWQRWSEPQNLGPSINTPLMEASYTATASGKYSYYVSKDTTQGSLDIFRLVLPDSARPKPIALITGRTLNGKTGRPIAADIYYERVSDGKEVGRAHSNPKSGEYTIALPAGERYGCRAESKGYASINDYFDMESLHNYTEIKRDLTLVPIEKGAVVRMNNIFFEFGKWNLASASFAELNRVVNFLNNYPDISIEIAGHTDSIGAPERNLLVSENRARAVADYLIGKGISQDRIIVRGYGASAPAAANTTEEERSKNRRVEFIIQ